MIVIIHAAGKSFKGLGTYLTHDADARTEERVAWTHTLNCANDHVPSAIDEMLWTSRDAELLKQEAGIRAGGRATENAAKHVSLNWSPDDEPTREHMIEATEDFLRHMKWDEHQAVLVAHEDKAHAHVHVMLNAVHPETGLKINESFEQRRAQAWALEYERQHENIRCENQLREDQAREQAMTRPAWMAFKEAEKTFSENEKSLSELNPEIDFEPENQKTREAREWELLKKHQRSERETFFADGKIEFSELRRSIYREVREEFRPAWAEFYADEKKGVDAETLRARKAELVSEQKEMLEARRDEACAELRESRNHQYRDLLDGQREMRHCLHERQDAGLASLDLIDRFAAGQPDRSYDIGQAFRETGQELTGNISGAQRPLEEAEGRPFAMGREDRGGMRSGTASAGEVSGSLAFGFASFFDFLADGLVHSNPAPRPQQVEAPDKPDKKLAIFAAEQSRESAIRDKAREERRYYEEELERPRD